MRCPHCSQEMLSPKVAADPADFVPILPYIIGEYSAYIGWAVSDLNDHGYREPYGFATIPEAEDAVQAALLDETFPACVWDIAEGTITWTNVTVTGDAAPGTGTTAAPNRTPPKSAPTDSSG